MLRHHLCKAQEEAPAAPRDLQGRGEAAPSSVNQAASGGLLEGSLAAEALMRSQIDLRPLPRVTLLTQAAGPHLGRKRKRTEGCFPSFFRPPIARRLSLCQPPLSSSSETPTLPPPWLSPRHKAAGRGRPVHQHAVCIPSPWLAVSGWQEDKG